MHTNVVVLLFLLIFSLSFSASAGQATLSWSFASIDVNATSGGYAPIAVDSNNTSHIAYSAIINGTYYVMYASQSGSNWTIQAAIADSLVLSFVLGTNGYPHVLYSFDPYRTSVLMYASWTGTRWTSQNTGVSNVTFTALALDSSGNPHIAYIVDDVLKYTSWNGVDWNIQTVDTVPDGSGLSSLAFDHNDTAYILYHIPHGYQDNGTGLNYNSESVKLATLKNSSWSIQTIPLSQPIYDNGNLVLDSAGNPHFVYTIDHYVSSKDVNVRYTVLYVSWNGSTWNTQTIASNVQTTGYAEPPSGYLCLDSKDNPHIASFITGVTTLTYTIGTDKTWESQIIDVSQPAYQPYFLALDANGNPHISYRTYTYIPYNGPLIYATATETTQTNSSSVPEITALAATALVIIISTVVVTYVRIKRKRL